MTCPKCKWPICDLKCKYLKKNHELECQYFVKNGIDIEKEQFKFGEIEQFYDTVSVLRILGHNDDCFQMLESHLSKWKSKPGWIQEHSQVISDLKTKLKITLSEDEILEIFGQCYTNDFSVRVDGGLDSKGNPRSCAKVRLCYALVAMCSHDCVPNTWRNIAGIEEGFRHDLRAKRNIKKGEKITISYEDTFLPSLIRRQNLELVSNIIPYFDSYSEIFGTHFLEYLKHQNNSLK